MPIRKGGKNLIIRLGVDRVIKQYEKISLSFA